MNDAEYSALLQPISNAARVLYVLGLRPNAHKTTGASEPLNYKALMSLLSDGTTEFTLGRHINRCLKELADIGLISLPDNLDIEKSLNKQHVVLPLVAVPTKPFQDLHGHKDSMHSTWQPCSELAKELAQLTGLIDTQYTSEDVGEFVAYWLGRPDTLLTQFQWTQKFISFLKMRRSARSGSTKKQVGSQLTSPTSGIEADENARKLVEKYATKQ
ncbi:DnaT-like ssDNA-binding domain-containing protein [Alteromonas oceanisediminis]|uniref:DnaT-like ssDNA-binding domain-containing protein n=1 Tax=Alteromonas oceanisediminis TaxID=2836180 RepID=UPI001BDB68F6|nr:DnaT-like ssDNA-binding domain-containing protein [Alteromonas oceanisediminis]MBT0586714.1 flavodoxin [Alteromonas oceanisediminis]